MSQRPRHSLLEACASTAIGYVIAFVTSLLTFAAFDLQASVSDTFWITNIFTIISVIRGYYIRRLFNWLHARNFL